MKQKTVLLGILFLVYSQEAFNQVVTEETITTDTISLLSQETVRQTKNASMVMPLVANAIVPGVGYYLVGDEQRAFASMTIEAVGLVSALWCSRYAQSLMTDSRNFATLYAGCRSSRVPSDSYWNTIGTAAFFNDKQYNEIQRLNGETDAARYYLSVDDRWAWISPEAQKRYRDIRSNGRRFTVASSFCIGVLVLNHIVSFVNLRFLTKNHFYFSAASAPLEGISLLDPDNQRYTLALIKKF
ncbi:MAG: hypothetical protein JW795_07215 [Chitinivibrionales bacterium]|nr:hypothetical protein [Chitinivibrionales bacterium]